MPVFEIDVVGDAHGYFEVEADRREQAVTIAENMTDMEIHSRVTMLPDGWDVTNIELME